MTNQSFVSEQLEKTAQELAAVRVAMKAQGERLADAEASLRFYADPRNYEATRKLDGKTVFQDRLKGDYGLADNDSNTNIAGRRAREYQKRYENR